MAKTLGVVLLVLTSGCLNSLDDRRQSVDTPSGIRAVVVQGLLDPRATVQTLWVEWSVPADSSWQGEPRPVDPSLVALRLVGPDSTPRLLAPGSPGQYTAQLQVYPDSVYRLEGTIGDSLIVATVRLPDSVRLQEPSTDTVRITPHGFQLPLRYSFEATGATVYFMVDQNGLSYRLSGTAGQVNLLSFQDTLAIRVEAYEPNAGEWIQDRQTPSPSNIKGAYGYLGALVQSRTVIVIPQ